MVRFKSLPDSFCKKKQALPFLPRPNALYSSQWCKSALRWTTYSSADFISQGRWSAACPDCGGTEYVEPEEPIFYCFSCGNFKINGKARKVVFPNPKKRKEIEKLLLERPMRFRGGSEMISRNFQARPVEKDERGRFLYRSWKPGELNQIKAENESMKKRERK